MFCSKCGRELPEGSRFCPWCGAEVGEAPKPAQPAPKRSRKPLVIGGIAVAAVAVIVASVLFATGVLGRDGKLPNGSFAFDDNAFGFSYYIEQEGDDQVIELNGYDDTNGTNPTLYTGTLEEDGSNELGKIWRVADLVDADGQPDRTVVRLQFPEGASSGELEGRWYLEMERDGETFSPCVNSTPMAPHASFSVQVPGCSMGLWAMTISCARWMSRRRWMTVTETADTVHVDGIKMGLAGTRFTVRMGPGSWT